MRRFVLACLVMKQVQESFEAFGVVPPRNKLSNFMTPLPNAATIRLTSRGISLFTSVDAERNRRYIDLGFEIEYLRNTESQKVCSRCFDRFLGMHAAARAKPSLVTWWVLIAKQVISASSFSWYRCCYRLSPSVLCRLGLAEMAALK